MFKRVCAGSASNDAWPLEQAGSPEQHVCGQGKLYGMTARAEVGARAIAGDSSQQG
jgi:hypothetical protein